MTALLHDVYWQAEKRNDYPEGVDFGEVLYADDTILIGKDHKEVQKVVQKIEEISKEYGLSLNREKCVHLRMPIEEDKLRKMQMTAEEKDNDCRVKFKNGMKMPTEEDTTY